jgi:GTP-binding protein HflX
MRAIRLPSVEKAILSDTVGFISDLPTQLVAAFRATLEEVTAADVIVHVRDISNPATAQQKTEVEEILADLGVIGEGGSTIPIVEAWNKWDLLSAEDRAMREAMITQGVPEDKVVPISAMTGEGTDTLLDLLNDMLTGGAQILELTVPVSDGQRLAWLHAHGEVLREEPSDDGAALRLSVRLSLADIGRFTTL